MSGFLFFILKSHHVTPTVTDLTFFHWCTEKHGEFIAHPLDCSKFIRCSHDRAYVFQCPAKLSWNQTIKTCDWETRTKCFLDGITEVDAASGEVKKRSVKRDTSLHSQPSQFSSTAEEFGSHTPTDASNASKGTTQVLEYPINSKSYDVVLLTTLKSILKTPCTKSSQKTDGKITSASSTVNRITEYVKIPASTPNYIEYETSTETYDLFQDTTNSNDALTELTTVNPNGNLIPTGLNLPSANDGTNKDGESLYLTATMTQKSYESMITTVVPDISAEFLNELSKQASSVPISIATEISTDTTITESATVRMDDTTSLTENQNVIETELSYETFSDELHTTKSNALLEVTDINVELREDGNTEPVFLSIVTEIQTEYDLETTQSATQKGNTLLTDSVAITEQNVTDINVEFTEAVNTELMFTRAVIETQTEVPVKITEHATESSNTMLQHSIQFNLELTKDDNTELIFTKATTERLTDYKPITVLAKDLTELYTNTPDDLTEATNNLGTGTEITSPPSENITETSNIAVSDSSMYSVKLTDDILKENELTTSAVQRTENLEYVTETLRGVTTELTEPSTNRITTIIDKFTDRKNNPLMLIEGLVDDSVITTLTDRLNDEYTTINSVKITDVKLQENVTINFNDIEAKVENSTTEFNSDTTDTTTNVKTIIRGFDTEPTTFTVIVTETSTDVIMVATLTDNDGTDEIETQDVLTETVINSTAVVNSEGFENTTPVNSVTDNYVLSTTTYSDGGHETTKEDDFKDSTFTIPIINKIKTSSLTTHDPVTNMTDSMLDLNSDPNIMLTTTTVVPSTVITESVTSTKIVDYSQKQKGNELNSDLFQERLLEVTPTVNIELLPLIEQQMSSDENVNINSISTTVLTSVASPLADGGSLSKEFLGISTTIDPRLPFRSPECRGNDNNRQFKASKCSQYYQCFSGWAFLLNCYEGYLFVAQEAKCLQDINRECNQ